MTKASDAARQEAIEKLRENMPKGSTIFTVLRHVSTSGMSRRISVVQVKGADNVRQWDYPAAKALDWKLHPKSEGIVVGGCGMDMGFHLVYTLGQVLHGDGYAFNHRWL